MRGNEIVPAARDVSGRKTEDGIGQGVALVMVIEEPRIGSAFGNCVLNLVQVQGERLLPVKGKSIAVAGKRAAGGTLAFKGKGMRRWLSLAVKYVVVLGLVVYLLDWMVFAVRRVDGRGTAKVVVQEYLATPLKGQRVEYDYMGKKTVTCAEALFPHGIYPVCWWVRRHKDEWK